MAMIEQLQSLMKALEAGSYSAQPAPMEWKQAVKFKTDLPYSGNDGEIICVESTGEMYTWMENSWVMLSSASYVEPQKPIENTGLIKQERHPHDPHKYYFGDHVWVNHK